MSEETQEVLNTEPVAEATEAVEEVAEGSEGEALEASEEEAKEAKDPWYKRRIDELTRDKHEARRQAERLEKLLEQQEAMIRQFTPKEEAQPVGLQPPNPAEFAGGQYDPRYMDAMLQYTRQSAVMEARQAVAAEYEQRQQAQAMAVAQQKLETAEAATRARYSDYDMVIEPITSDPRLARNPTIRAALLEMDNGPEIAYALGRNLDVAYEIAGMNPIQAGIKLASVLQNMVAPSKATAPKPIKPISGSGGSTAQRDLNNMSTSEYIAFMNKQEREAKMSRFRK